MSKPILTRYLIGATAVSFVSLFFNAVLVGVVISYHLGIIGGAATAGEGDVTTVILPTTAAPGNPIVSPTPASPPSASVPRTVQEVAAYLGTDEAVVREILVPAWTQAGYRAEQDRFFPVSTSTTKPSPPP